MNNEDHIYTMDTFFAEDTVRDSSTFPITQTTGKVTASNDLNKFNATSYQQITLLVVSLGLAMMTVFAIVSILLCFMCRNERLVPGNSFKFFSHNKGL